MFSPATRAQLGLSRDLADQIKGEGLDAVRAVLNDCLTRAPPSGAVTRSMTSDAIMPW